MLVMVGCGPLLGPEPETTPGVVVDNEYAMRRAAQEKEDAEKKKPYVAPPTGTPLFYEGETPVEIWKNGNDGNDGGIEGGNGKQPKISQDRAYYVADVYTYHWNDGKGQPIAGTIALRAADGTTYGPWQAEIYNKVYWHATPKEVIPAGTYTLIDSDPKTWAQNSESKGTGMGWANGTPVK